MNKFTPGPWVHSTAGYGRGDIFIVDECFVAKDGDDVALCENIIDPNTGDPSEANARLIEAAPDLLEALEETFTMIGERLLKDTFGYEWYEKASAAISRARGEA